MSQLVNVLLAVDKTHITEDPGLWTRLWWVKPGLWGQPSCSLCLEYMCQV